MSIMVSVGQVAKIGFALSTTLESGFHEVRQNRLLLPG
jgi:hypothetical protein